MEPTAEQIEIIERFVTPFYAAKDTMHGLAHITRVLKKARYLARGYADQGDALVLAYSAYLHGLIYQEEARIRRFLESQGLAEQRVERIVRAAWESQKEEQPATLEGVILHDAHLIEGGRTFIVVKSLVTGTARGQTLEETLAYIEELVLGRFTCYLPEARRLYAEKETYARAFLDDLRTHL
jgi:uncharacterized protein